MILIKVSCTGKFCYQHGNFQTTEAITGGVLKNQIKVSQNHGKTPNPWSHHHGLITIFFDHYNPFQLSQSFSIITIFFITIFFSLFTVCDTIFMKISERVNSIN